MRILFVTPRFPYPLLKGDKLRTYYFVKYLNKRGHKISLLSFIEHEKEKYYLHELSKYCELIETVLLPRWKSYLNMAFSVFSKIPFQMKYYSSNLMAEKIRSMIKKDQYDIIHFVLSRITPYVNLVNNNPVVIDHIDSLSMNMQRRAGREKGIKKIVFYLEWQKVRLYEKNNHNFFKYSIVTSQVDKEYLNNTNIEVVPNGVDVEYFTPLDREKDIDLIFTGNMGYFPNEDAVLYFSKEVFPFILKRRPDTNFFIVGINPSFKIKSLADGKNIFVTGYVGDLRDYLNRARVSVCPMMSGSGIQNKILEAMANGVPVVATSHAIGGIRANSDKDIIISDEPEEFSEHVLNLLEDNELCKRITLSAQQLVKEKYSWEASVTALESVYASVVKKVGK